MQISIRYLLKMVEEKIRESDECPQHENFESNLMNSLKNQLIVFQFIGILYVLAAILAMIL